MVTLLSLTCGVLLCVLGVYIVSVRIMVHNLEESLCRDQHWLLDKFPQHISLLGFKGLIREINRLLSRHKAAKGDENGGFSKQVEAMFDSIQEAVFILATDRTILFANESARNFFQKLRPLRGVRLESVLQSSSLLEFLAGDEKNASSQLKEISVVRGGKDVWFEASYAPIRGFLGLDSAGTLLVLHDINRLKSLEMMRRDFVANVSHELRTPLTIIKGFAETLAESNVVLPAEDRARFINKIINNAERLHLLVEDLLTLSRLESESDRIDPGLHSLSQLFEDTAESYRHRLDPKSQEIVIEIDERIGKFVFDRYQINQVLDNLVENVFRYAPEFTKLILRAIFNEKESQIECSIEDDGPGIPARDVPQIFDRFHRVDKGRSRERGGTGLGLSIAKHIVQLHQGEVYAESELGEGTCIHFNLPYMQALAGST